MLYVKTLEGGSLINSPLFFAQGIKRKKALSGVYSISFNLPLSHSLLDAESTLVWATSDEDSFEYVIKDITPDSDNIDYFATQNRDDFASKVFINLIVNSQNITDCLAWLSEIGWTLAGAETLVSVKTFDFEGNGSEYLDFLAEQFNLVFSYNYTTKTIIPKTPDSFIDHGVYFTPELNSDSLEFNINTSDFISRIYPFGKDDITIDSVNNGLLYVENKSFSQKTICAVWRDDRYTDPQSLMDAALEKLDVTAIPQNSYKVKVRDLASTNPELYLFLNYDLGDKVTLLNPQQQTSALYQIIEMEIYPDSPEDNTVSLNLSSQDLSQYIRRDQTNINNVVKSLNQQQIQIVEILSDISGIALRVSDSYTQGETNYLIESQLNLNKEEILAEVSSTYSTQESLATQVSVLNDQFNVQINRIQNANRVRNSNGQNVEGPDVFWDPIAEYPFWLEAQDSRFLSKVYMNILYSYDPMMGWAGFKQSLQLEVGETYTLSALCKIRNKAIVSESYEEPPTDTLEEIINLSCAIARSDDNNIHLIELFDSSVFLLMDDYARLSVTFVATEEKVDLILFANLGYRLTYNVVSEDLIFDIGDIMLNKGSTAFSWTLNENEVQTTNFKLDESGFSIGKSGDGINTKMTNREFQIKDKNKVVVSIDKDNCIFNGAKFQSDTIFGNICMGIRDKRIDFFSMGGM